MNIQREPLDFRDGGLPSRHGNGFQRAVAGRLPAQADAELGNAYASMSDEGEATFQEEFSDRWSNFRTPLGDALRGNFRAIPGYIGGLLSGGGGPDAVPKNTEGIRGSLAASFTAPPTAAGLAAGLAGGLAGAQSAVRTITPGFLRTDAEDDFASSCCPSLGFKTRLVGCAACFCLGQFLQFLSIGGLAGVLVGHPGRFAGSYTLGNLFMLGASLFLVGPKAQCRKLQAKDRALTSSLFFGAMVLTLVVVFAGNFFGRALVILFLVIGQWLAQIWYILSYIPYGQSIGRGVAMRVIKCCGIM